MFCVAYWVIMPSFNLAKLHLQCTMVSIFDWEVCRLGMRDTLNHGTITVYGFGYFHKNCHFLWRKNVSKTKQFGRTIHYTCTSYNKYFRLVWFQRSCGSRKLVSFCSSIDLIERQALMRKTFKRKVKEQVDRSVYSPSKAVYRSFSNEDISIRVNMFCDYSTCLHCYLKVCRRYTA